MRRILAIPLTLVTFVAVFFATILFGISVMIFAHFRRTQPVVEGCIYLWSRIWLIGTGCRLRWQGRELVDQDQSYVVVANHLSNLDIMACFLALPIPIRFLAKKELFKIPVLAQAMSAIGIVRVDRGGRSQIHEYVNRAARELTTSGRSVIIFPEGTRSRTGELQKFKKGAFTLAVAGQIPVIPVTIQGTYSAWPPWRWYVIGNPISVTIHPPISTIGLTQADTSTLMRQVFEIIGEAYEQEEDTEDDD